MHLHRAEADTSCSLEECLNRRLAPSQREDLPPQAKPVNEQRGASCETRGIREGKGGAHNYAKALGGRARRSGRQRSPLPSDSQVMMKRRGSVLRTHCAISMIFPFSDRIPRHRRSGHLPEWNRRMRSRSRRWSASFSSSVATRGWMYCVLLGVRDERFIWFMAACSFRKLPCHNG